MDVVKTFEEVGGEFVTPPKELLARLQKIKAVVFDWDGVFNLGMKGENAPSNFVESDSMAINLFRYFLWRKNDFRLPIAAIITGADNPTAKYFAERENFHAAFCKFKNKRHALNELSATFNVEPDEVCFFFDDVLDFSVAELAGLRIMVNRDGSPLTRYYSKIRGLVDYHTGTQGGNGAIREAVEMMLGLSESFESIVDNRMQMSSEYQQYWLQRGAIVTSMRTFEG